MAVTTGAPDEEPEEGSSTESTGFTINRTGLENFQRHLESLVGRAQVHNVVHGDFVVGTGVQSRKVLQEQADNSLARQRQKFYLDFLKQSLKQAEVTFWLSIAFMAAGAIVILVGAVLALVYAQSADLSYVPLVTALTGALITVGGGALALHARRAKAHVTEQAERIGDKADKDDGLRTTLRLINQVSDKDLRDRIRTAVALQALGVTADPETIASSLLADPKGEIESGDSKP
ncbi:hypothetical protein [Nocardiopsis sp. B62]|uniref:TRADD-N-associated membrane domain-containing protein n=1 Tax=Nocardiopsis sp. B62 TaxID=2824874 RepID=UPI001B36489A|nr:hypothetical protein [Nocardiopsis sp. B62]MBQ1081560.1 hypothetical protein [Nocardiopsis sp. B62]